MKDAKRDEETVRKWKSNYEKATQKGNAKKAMTEYESLTTNVSLDCKVASSENDLMAEDLPQNIEDYIDEEVRQAICETREAVSEGEENAETEDDKSERTRKVSKAFRAVKIW